jgi:hypothetical protein
MNSTFPLLRRAATIAAIALLVTYALAAGPAAAETVTYTHESQQAYEQQLAAHEIAQARINKFVRHLDLTLKNGQHFVYVYAPKSEPTVYAALIAKHIPVEVLTPAVAQAEAKKAPVHHKIRYIVGGVVIAIAIIVVAVLLIDRRRKAIAE